MTPMRWMTRAARQGKISASSPTIWRNLFSAIGEYASYSMAAIFWPFSVSRTTPENSTKAPPAPENSAGSSPWPVIGSLVNSISIFIRGAGTLAPGNWRDERDFIALGETGFGRGIFAITSHARGGAKVGQP